MEDRATFSAKETSERLGRQVAATVHQTEAITGLVPVVLFGVIWLAPVAIGLTGRGGIVNAIVVGAVMAVVVSVAVKLVHNLVLEPLRVVRYGRAARALEGQMRSEAQAVLTVYTWFDPRPGALAILRDDTLVLADAPSGYAFLRLPPEALRNITVERDASQVTRTKQSARFMLGAGGSLFGATGFRRRSRSVTHTDQAATLQLRYRFSQTAPIRIAAIVFRSDARTVEELRVALQDLRARQWTRSTARSSIDSFLQ